jgi:cytochrome P450
MSGDTAYLDIGGPTLLVADPRDVRHVLVTAADAYGKSPRIIGSAARKSLGDNLFTADGDDHVSLRRATARVFRPRLLAARLPCIERRCEEFVDGAVARGGIDSMAHIAPWGAACVVETLLGAGIAPHDDRWPRALEKRRREVEVTVARQSLPFLRRWEGRPIDAGLAALVDGALDNTADPDAPLCGLASSAPGVPQAQRCDQVVSLLLAAYETTVMMLAWTLDLLARHPEWQSPCAERSVAERVLSESLRLAPPTWLVVRIARESDRLPSGVLVPVGCKIYLSPYVSHRRCAAFAQPETFDPDRFLPDRPVDPFSYFPFGAGARSCLGEGLARGIGTAFLIAMTRRVTLVPIGGRAPRAIGGLTLRPARPVRIAVLPRPR